ncbi:MAG: SUMF1/EgtB/PvdO family nonheme iron enzyme [Thiohalomonadales bacterium]
MSDIFLSYAKSDRKTAKALAGHLQSLDYDVWWDHEIQPGKEFRRVIDEEITKAKVVLVLWSKQAIQSRWVQDEANEALEQEKLIPVLIEDVKQPMGFRQLQACILYDNKAIEKASEFRKLIEYLRTRILPKTAAPDKPQPISPPVETTTEGDAVKYKPILLWNIVLGVVLITGVIVYAKFVPQINEDGGDAITQQLERQRRESAQFKAAKEDKQATLLAKQQQNAQAKTVVTPPRASASTVANRPQPGTTFQDTLKDGNKGPEMRVLKGGRFLMGAADKEPGSYKSEFPQHEVLIRSFVIGRSEVTFADYARFAKATGTALPDDLGMGWGPRPVFRVNWNAAQAYAAWLSTQTGKDYRLPTEAEWEYTARAGGNTSYWWGNAIGSNNANCNGCGSHWDKKQRAPVKSLKPNGFGVYDTVGNVWEWVQDCYHDNYGNAPADGSAWESTNCASRVLRSGSWNGDPQFVRSANRNGDTPGNRGSDIGFRLARTL